VSLHDCWMCIVVSFGQSILRDKSFVAAKLLESSHSLGGGGGEIEKNITWFKHAIKCEVNKFICLKVKWRNMQMYCAFGISSWTIYAMMKHEK
jgi:hypothetical protein